MSMVPLRSASVWVTVSTTGPIGNYSPRGAAVAKCLAASSRVSASRSSPAASSCGNTSRSFIRARKTRVTVTSCAGRWTDLDPVTSADLTGGHHLEVRAAPGVSGEHLEPALLPHPAAEGRAGNAGAGDLELQAGTDPPAFADPGLVDVDAAGGQVLPEESVRQLPAQPDGPAVEILALEGVHRLAIAPMMAAVPDEVPDQAAPQSCGLRTWVANLDRSGDGLLADPCRLGALVRVRTRPAEIDRVENGHHVRLLRPNTCASAVSDCGGCMKAADSAGLPSAAAIA